MSMSEAAALPGHKARTLHAYANHAVLGLLLMIAQECQHVESKHVSS